MGLITHSAACFRPAELTDRLEGSIVRCIVRLDETCRDVRNSARVIGDPVLYQKMEEVRGGGGEKRGTCAFEGSC